MMCLWLHLSNIFKDHCLAIWDIYNDWGLQSWAIFFCQWVRQYISLNTMVWGWGVWRKSSIVSSGSVSSKEPGATETDPERREPLVWPEVPFVSCRIMLRRHFARAFWNHTWLEQIIELFQSVSFFLSLFFKFATNTPIKIIMVDKFNGMYLKNIIKIVCRVEKWLCVSSW